MALLGQVALVLGGSSGIGLATVEELLRAGMSVVVGDVAKETGEDAVNKLQAQFGLERAIFVHVDVRSKEQVEDAFVSTKQYFKKIDVFINSAGILNDMQWELEVDINFNGIIRGTLAAWNHMGKHEGGRGGTVINIASQLGLEAFAGSPIYCATKHGVIGFSRSCGEPYHVRRTGVRVITVCPALTQTPLIDETSELKQLTEDMKTESYRAMSTFPTQKPENVARGVRHVLQHAASGSVWVSEGGEDIYEVAIPKRQDL
ncbi:15-hydroxyprostaglandin dehydrogenase [NAD+], partial [Gryllus bimaculatus]